MEFGFNLQRELGVRFATSTHLYEERPTRNMREMWEQQGEKHVRKEEKK